MNKEELIKIWKENNISNAEFDFTCGGDSMNDYSISFFNEKDQKLELEEDLKQEFIDLVFDNVVFYETSDGYYLGEYGIVHITFDQDENDFILNKESHSEYLEQINKNLYVELTDVESDYYKKYISDVVISDNGFNTYITYAKDFIKTDEYENIEKNIIEKVLKEANNVEHSISLNHDYQNYFDINDFSLNEDVLEFTVSYSVIKTEV